MKRILFFVVPVFLLAFCLYSKPVFSQMETDNKAGIDDFPKTDSRIPRGADNDPAIGNRNGLGIHLHLGPASLGVEGKYVPVDPTSKFGDTYKSNSAVIFGLGFRF